ncbi:cytochrome P450 family protein [Nocardiopsis sp. M1B1]|uniref:cytochrome P450 family protein n=1 Tax=Nocardiopsis sp. M1B1 TaxID=3450454 RepID=UPI00403A35CD
MSAPQTTPVTGTAITHPITVGSPEFLADPHAHYAWLRENAPVYRGRMAYMGEQDVWLVSRYADCRKLLSDARFQRSPQGRGPAMIARMPDSVREPMRLLTTSSMIMMDDPGHRRLRGLVVKPFTPKAIARLGDRVGDLANSLLDELEPSGRTELRERFALPIPATVINEMVGVPHEDRDRFGRGMKALITGLAEIGQADWVREVNTLTGFVRELIDRKRSDPGPDILTGLIQAEEQGDRLSDDELVAMVFLLVTAGYETTYNLITSAVVTLLDHPRQLARLRDAPQDEALWRGAVEEILRYGSPLGGTKPVTTVEDVTWHGTTIPAGSSVIPLLGAADRDPAAFDAPEVFDIGRHPNNHLGFGHGVHFCLGANLARMETRVALGTLFGRNPNLRLAVDRSELEFEPLPFWTRYRELPVHLG